MIQRCEFCKGNFELRHRLPFGNSCGKVLVVLPFDFACTEESKEAMSELYPDAFFMWRISCENPSDYNNAKIGCGIFVRWEVDKFDIVAVERQYVKEFFGNVSEDSTQRLANGKVLIPYVDIQQVYAEVKRATA